MLECHALPYAGYNPHLSTGYDPLALEKELRDNPRDMENGEKTLIDRIDERLDAMGISARELSMRTNGKPDLVRDLRRRGHAPSADNLAKMATVLGVSVDWLVGKSNATAPVKSEVGVSNKLTGWNGSPKRDEPGIPLVGTGDCADLELETETGEIVDIERSSFDPDHTVQIITRPPALLGAKDLYAIYFRGESMMPRFEPGEVAIVDPTRPPRPGDYVLVQLNNGEEDDVISVLVKRLVSANSREVSLHQFNPDITFKVPRKRIARLHRIMPQTDLLFG